MAGTFPFRLGYSVISWGSTPNLDEVLGTIAAAGWEGVEFIGVSLDWLGTPSRLRRLVDKHGLVPVCTFGSTSIAEDREAQQERQRRLIEYAAELGCSIYATIGGRRVHRRLPTEDEFRQLAVCCEELIDWAAPLGVTVAYHAHPLCTVETEAEQDRMLAYAPRLQVCVDVSVAAMVEEDAVDQLKKYRRRLAYVHMKDRARGKFVEMGKGTRGLDFARILGTLDELEYRGWVMGELSSYADADAAEACRYNRRYLGSLGY
ncbi:MAG: sugar phosphate isomerase/epimerase [Chloroflexi bacterium]|nr:sugar phosphate isomerase/epimerase [Chloroflexota bacterium]